MATLTGSGARRHCAIIRSWYAQISSRACATSCTCAMTDVSVRLGCVTHQDHGVPVPRNDLETPACEGAKAPAHRRCVTVPFLAAGEKKDLDAKLKTFVEDAWYMLSNSSSTLASRQEARVLPAVRGLSRQAPWTSCSAYVLRDDKDTKKHIDFDDDDTVLNFIATEARDVKSGHMRRTKGGALNVLVACSKRALSTGQNAIVDVESVWRAENPGVQEEDAYLHGLASSRAVQDLVTSHLAKRGGAGAYPRTRREVQAAIDEGRAVILRIPAGAIVTGQFNRFWHWVEALHSEDVGCERVAAIAYVHSSVYAHAPPPFPLCLSLRNGPYSIVCALALILCGAGATPHTRCAVISSHIRLYFGLQAQTRRSHGACDTSARCPRTSSTRNVSARTIGRTSSRRTRHQRSLHR